MLFVSQNAHACLRGALAVASLETNEVRAEQLAPAEDSTLQDPQPLLIAAATLALPIFKLENANKETGKMTGEGGPRKSPLGNSLRATLGLRVRD
jgi:hypothetical protein